MFGLGFSLNKATSIGGFTGALDSYTGADAVYSVYRLYTSYTGNLIRVRRSSDSTEQDIGFNGSGYLDTAALLAFVGAGDGFVTTWYNQGSGGDATQTTASFQPKIVSSGSLNTDGGLAALAYDGTSSIMNMSVPVTAGFSIFGIYKNTKPNSHMIGSSPELGRRSNDQYRFNGSGLATNGGTHPDTRIILTGIEDDTNGTIYSDGVQVAQAASSFTSATLAQIGKGNPTGDFQAVVIYNTDQTSNRTGIETALNNLFSVY